MLETGENVFVLLHGVGCSGKVWRDVVPGLVSLDEARVFELPRTGPTPDTSDWVSVPMLAAAVREQFEREALEDVVLIGHSLGGMVAQELACADASRLRALVLCNTLSSGSDVAPINEGLAELADQEGSVALATTMAPGLLGTAAGARADALQQLLIEMFTETGSELVAAQLRAVPAFDVTDRLAQVLVPTLVVAGSDEGTAYADVTVELLPRAELFVMAGGGHMAPMEDPDAFTGAVLEFLESIEDQERTQ